MRDGNPDESNPRMPIGGSSGAIILAALKRLALHAGDISITINKRRTESGGYRYTVTHSEGKNHHG